MKFISSSEDLSKYLEISIKKSIEIKSISTDTRTLNKGSLFIAIKGEFFDGNNHIDEAIKKGASLIISDSKEYLDSKNKRIIYVKNSVLALKKIAKNIIKE